MSILTKKDVKEGHEISGRLSLQSAEFVELVRLKQAINGMLFEIFEEEGIAVGDYVNKWFGGLWEK